MEGLAPKPPARFRCQTVIYAVLTLRLDRHFLVILAFVIFAFVSIVGICVRRQILRHHAELLLGDMQSINLRQTTFQQIQPILKRWRRWERLDGPCTPERCKLVIVLSGPDSAENRFLNAHIGIRNLVAHFGERPTLIGATLTILDGIVWESGIELEIDAPVWVQGTQYLDRVGGSAFSDSSLRLFFGDRHRRLHPEYNISSAANLQNLVRMDFTPFANMEEIHRLMFLDFSCLTRWSPCQNKNDIMPIALAEVRCWRSFPDDPETACTDPIALEGLGRDSPNILLVRISASRPVREKIAQTIFRGHQLTFHIEQALKTRTRFSDLAPFTIYFPDFPGSKATYAPDDRVILIFKETGDNFYSMNGCSRVEPTMENLAALRRGVAQDTRPGALIR